MNTTLLLSPKQGYVLAMLTLDSGHPVVLDCATSGLPGDS